MSSSVPALAVSTAQTGRYSVDLLALCKSDELVDPEPLNGVSLRCLPLSGVRGIADLVLYKSLRPILRQAHVVHVHGVWQQHSVTALALAAQMGIPTFVSAHGMLESWAVNNKRLKKTIYSALVERRRLRRSACLRALTLTEVGDYRRYGLTNPAVVIPNGISPPGVADPGLFLDKFPNLRGRRTVLFLSRIHYKKGLVPLCHAWARISRQFPEATLVIAGPDFENTLKSLKALIVDLGLENRVVLTGMMAGAIKWSALAASECFTLPSFSEGFSVAVLEAMAMGLPVVISHQCNFPEIVDRGCGWLIQPEVEQIADALAELLGAPAERRREIGENGRRLIAAKYNWSTIGQQMADVYDWTRGGPKPGSTEILV
ncbi:MAG: glycosyltransferase [Bryobacteraceae bacterium]|jgi:glycosyltransferase involved in cell wall biosynthesis